MLMWISSSKSVFYNIIILLFLVFKNWILMADFFLLIRPYCWFLIVFNISVVRLMLYKYNMLCGSRIFLFNDNTCFFVHFIQYDFTSMPHYILDNLEHFQELVLPIQLHRFQGISLLHYPVLAGWKFKEQISIEVFTTNEGRVLPKELAKLNRFRAFLIAILAFGKGFSK